MCTTLCKVTTCDTIYIFPRPSRYTIMKISPVWLSAEVQARVEPLIINLIKKQTDDVSECYIIKIKMRWNPSDADSETYELNIATFENGQP